MEKHRVSQKILCTQFKMFGWSLWTKLRKLVLEILKIDEIIYVWLEMGTAMFQKRA